MDDTHKTQHGPAAAAAGAPETARYEQDLSRSIGILGNVFITLSGVTPASSVFIIVPVALVAAGSGSFLAFVFAAVVGVFMAFCWAELSAAFPIAAGDYALVWHSLKGRTSWLAGPVSFVTFALYVDFIAFIPAVIALGRIGLLYWLAVIFPQRGRAWTLREAVFDEAAAGGDG